MSTYLGDRKVGLSFKKVVEVPVTVEKTVTLYTPYGEEIASYSKAEFLALTAYPTAPTLDRLTFQEYNWSLADAKTYVTDYTYLSIGAIYKTTSGISEFDIELTPITGLTFTLRMDGTKNWGDGTSDTTTSHTYSTYGNYTITCNGTAISSSNTNPMFGQGSNYNYSVKEIRFSGLSSIPNYAVKYCSSLERIVISKDVTNYLGTSCLNSAHLLKAIVFPNTITSVIGNTLQNCSSLVIVCLPKTITRIYSNAFDGCRSLKTLYIPSSVTTLDQYFLENCYSLEFIQIPNSVTSLGTSAFYNNYSLKRVILSSELTTLASTIFYNNYCLEEITIPSKVTTTNSQVFNNCYCLKKVVIKGNITTIAANTFYYCPSVLLYDFTSATSVPTLSNTNAFTGINALCKIVVPDSLYETWKTTGNWVTYANYIYKASEVV